MKFYFVKFIHTSGKLSKGMWRSSLTFSTFDQITIKFDKLFLDALFILHLELNQYLLVMQCSLIVYSLPCRKLLRIILVSLCLRDFTAISSLLPRTWVPFLCWTRSIACTLTLLTGRHSIYTRGNSKPTGESCRPWIVGMRYCRFLFLQRT